MKTLLFSIAFTLGSLCLNNINAQVVIIGNAPSYAGDEIAFYTTHDLITRTGLLVGKGEVDMQGNFRIDIPTTETLPVFAVLGVYKGFLTVEPGKTYTVSLPVRQEKSVADFLNPFFEHDEFYFPIENVTQDDINSPIRSIDRAYSDFIAANYSDIIKRGHYLRTKIEAFNDSIRKAHFGADNRYLATYLEYKAASVRSMAFERDYTLLQKKYFCNRPVEYYNEAYMQFFNDVFENYLLRFSKTKEGRLVVTDIVEDRSFLALMNTLRNDSSLSSDTLKELVILKGIYDAFYGLDFPKPALIEIADSISMLSKIARHRDIAECVKERFTLMQPGFPPPPLTLYDQEGNLRSLSDYASRFVYLVFFTADSYTCMQHTDVLKSLNEKYKEYFDILIVYPDSEPKVPEIFSGTNIPLLNCSKDLSVLSAYGILVFPSYFLVGPDGKLVFSPAAPPDGDFIPQFGEVFQTWKNNQLLNGDR